MAKITSLIKFQGTINGLTVDKNGMAKAAPKPCSNLANRTKENNSEFGLAAKQGKVIRDALKVLKVGDEYLNSRMLQVVRSGIALDETNERGKRILSSKEAKIVLKDFELNKLASLQSVASIKFDFVVGATETTFNLKNLTDGDVTLKDLLVPESFTHAAAVAIASTVNINPQVLLVKDIKVVQSEIATKDEVISLPVLKYKAPAADEMVIIALAIKFYKQVKGELQSGAGGAAKIVDIYFV